MKKLAVIPAQAGSQGVPGNLDPGLRRDDEASRRGAALRFITCGSVDDGKSTLIGRLLVDSKAVLQDQLAGVQRSGATDLALLTDGLSADVSERGATRMDDKTSEASMEKRKKDGYF